MRICIPTEDDRGLEAAVARHMGRAPFLTLVDTDSGEMAVLANAPHDANGCFPAQPLAGRGVEAVVCSGAGRRAVAALQAAGIRVLSTDASRVDAAVAAVRREALHTLTVEDACGGRHGHEGAGDHPCHGKA
jgi:predicted Fe-Mo cluster-binding NifX family protein